MSSELFSPGNGEGDGDGDLDSVRRQLDLWVEAGWLRELDRVFALFLLREAPDAHPLLLLAAALASHQLGRGHTCLALDAVLAHPAEVLALPPGNATRRARDDTPAPSAPATLLAGIDLGRWRAALTHPRLVGDGVGNTPLVLAGTRLYLRRYWQFERSVRQAIDLRVTLDPMQAPAPASLRRALQALFPSTDSAAPDWQKLACALAVRSGFSVITGGPGTGKTTTVVKLLAVLQHLALTSAQGGRPLRIRMAAPTGKAAARLNESIAGAVASLALDGLPDGDLLRAAIPTEVTTLHRLLGSRPDTRRFRHDAHHPLPLDVLVIDEASMIDLEMMAAVFDALPPRARLVLLGDKDQLASVEAGAVLGELCLRADRGHYTPATRDWLAQVADDAVDDALVDPHGHPLDQAIAKLRHSYRFTRESGIGRLADAVNAGDLRALRDVQARVYTDLAWLSLATDPGALKRLVLDGACNDFPGGPSPPDAPVGYRHYLRVMHDGHPAPGQPQPVFDRWAADVLKAFGSFQLLCAVRGGAQGVEAMNRQVARLLQAEALTASVDGWYLGRPVMVTRNDHALGLMNGDIGVTLALPNPDGAAAASPWILRVAFASGGPDDGIHWVLPSRLQSVDTVFAMTVHKSQGSEFVHAALLLPDRPSPVLTRELVYTGVTRARRWFTLATSDRAQAMLAAAVVQRVERASGLME